MSAAAEDGDGRAPEVVAWPRSAPGAEEQWVALTVAVDGPWVVPCRVADPELWWSPASEAEAVLECARACPAVAECRAYAVAARERYGVWGGTTPGQRRALRGAS